MQRPIVLFLCFALVAVFVAGLFAIATPSDALDARLALEKPLARWMALGGSNDPGVMAPPRLPATSNAATVYRRAFEELKRLDAADRKLLDIYTLRNRPQDVASIAPRLEAVVAIARAAAGMSRCEWSRGFYRTGGLTPEDLAEFDQFVKLAAAVGAHATARAEAGDVDTAVADLAAMRRMAGHATKHPHIAQASMGLFIDIAAFDVLERAFRDRKMPDQSALAVTGFRDHRAAMRRTFLTYGTGILLQLDDPAIASADTLESWQRDLAKAWFLDAMCERVDALDEPGRRAIRTAEPPEDVDYARVFLPAPSVHEAINAAATRNDMAAAAVKLRSHRAAGGGYPDTWAIPINPKTGVFLTYRRDGKGFVLSSEDGKIEWRWTS